eukprot:282538-Chlamydomonas_euryale.AAC.4
MLPPVLPLLLLPPLLADVRRRGDARSEQAAAAVAAAAVAAAAGCADGSRGARGSAPTTERRPVPLLPRLVRGCAARVAHGRRDARRRPVAAAWLGDQRVAQMEPL